MNPFTILILDDQPGPFRGTIGFVKDCFARIHGTFAAENSLRFLPEVRGHDERWTQDHARDYLNRVRQTDLVRSVDLCLIDVNWAPGREDNWFGLRIATLLEAEGGFLKVLYSGRPSGVVWERIQEEMTEVNKYGRAFFRSALRKPGDFLGGGIEEAISEAFEEFFKKRRRQELSERVRPSSVLEIVSRSEVSPQDVISVRTGEGDVATELQEIFFETQGPTFGPAEGISEYLRSELEACLAPRSRFSLMRQFCRDELDSIKMMTHSERDVDRADLFDSVMGEESKPYGELLKDQRSFLEFHQRSTRRYYQHLRKELEHSLLGPAAVELQFLDSLLDKFQNTMLKAIASGDWTDVQGALFGLREEHREQLRMGPVPSLVAWLEDVVLDDLLNIKPMGHDDLGPVETRGTIWGPICAEVLPDARSRVLPPRSFFRIVFSVIEPETGEACLRVSSSRRGRKSCWLAVFGRCKDERPRHEYREGAFDVRDGESLSRVFLGCGGSLHNVLDTLVPLYFSPLLVESFDGDRWHCINLSRPLGSKDEGITGFQVVNAGDFDEIVLDDAVARLDRPGVRFLLRFDLDAALVNPVKAGQE